MKKLRLAVALMAASLILPPSALAWDETGHKTVARIAWDNMTPQARTAAINLLLSAPNDTGMRRLLPNDGRPEEVRYREFFQMVSTWPDIVRTNSAAYPHRKEKYHQPKWHYINLFWEDSGGTPANVDKPPRGKLITQLEEFGASVGGAGAAGERAIQLAWIVHLMGDIHQPLHCSARISSFPGEQDGDIGGNTFYLDNNVGAEYRRTLHSYWDAILTRTYDPTGTDDEYIGHIAGIITSSHTKDALTPQLMPGAFMAWAEKGRETAKAFGYPQPPLLRRNHTPSYKYRMSTYKAAEPAVALAGYRLADMLNKLFGS